MHLLLLFIWFTCNFVVVDVFSYALHLLLTLIGDFVFVASVVVGTVVVGTVVVGTVVVVLGGFIW